MNTTKMPTLALLAGGLASRMLPLTSTVPKSLLVVAGRPFISHQLALFKREGVERVVVCTGHLGEQISEYVGDGSRWGLNVTFSPDGPVLLGTGGALKQALPHLGAEFLVTYGDSWLDIPFGPIVQAFRDAGKLGLMTVFRNDGKWDSSNIEFSGNKILRYDKVNKSDQMKFIDFGLQVLRSEVLGGQSNEEYLDLATVYSEIVDAGQMAGYEVNQRFYEIGSQRGLSETDKLLGGSEE